MADDVKSMDGLHVMNSSGGNSTESLPFELQYRVYAAWSEDFCGQEVFLLKKWIVLIFVSCFVAKATPSYAGFGAGVDVGLTIPMDQEDAWLGYSLNARVFKEWGYGLVAVGVQGMGNFQKVGDRTLGRGMLGARVTVGPVVKGYFAAHAGYGSGSGMSGWTYSLGTGLSFKAGPLRIGVYGRYNDFRDDMRLKWIDTGASAELAF